MREDLDKLSALVKSGSESDQILRFQEPVKNLQDNLQFMKDLNQVFTFLPLPVRLKDREAHADLYVFTRKKALNDKRENLSVLLHLDMENLGSLNVHIQMNPNNKIQADFYLEDSEAGRLIKENLPSLTAGLQKKGYSIQAEVKASYKKPDFSRDFIEQSMPDHDIRRYTFDIRT
jgi:flagellar hook-length control protein FliK